MRAVELAHDLTHPAVRGTHGRDDLPRLSTAAAQSVNATTAAPPGSPRVAGDNLRVKLEPTRLIRSIARPDPRVPDPLTFAIRHAKTVTLMSIGRMPLHSNVCSLDTGRMITVNEVEIARRSAAMAPLSKDQTFRILAELERLLRERAHIAEVLGGLSPSFASVRKTLNELQRLVG